MDQRHKGIHIGAKSLYYLIFIIKASSSKIKIREKLRNSKMIILKLVIAKEGLH
jgi:hypothetical protein